ncbi:MAG: hypothetical protein ACXIUQ_08335 [Cecembia sp.]
MHDLSNKPWSQSRKILFRLVFAYVFLYCFAFPLYFFPYGSTLIHPIGSQLQNLAIWLGQHLFGIVEEIPTAETGSGDTLIYWLLWATKTILALIVTVVWSTLDRKRASYQFLQRVLITYVRYFVALIIFSYGMAKVIPTQFSEPSYTQLMKTYGESSPMNLLWTLMGYSTPYQIFGGIMEVLAAVLLLFRRTVLLGALVMMTVMANVVAMNFAFDVPVKLASSHYLLFSIGLAWIFRRNLIALFFLQKPSQPISLKPIFLQKRAFIVTQIFKTVFLGYFFYSAVSNNLNYQKRIKDGALASPLSGVYHVQLKPMANDSLDYEKASTSIKRLIFDNYRPERLTVAFEDDSKIRYLAEYDEEKQLIKAVLPSDSTNRMELTYRFDEEGRLYLKGTYKEDSLALELNRIEIDSLLLVKKKFQWISPVPFNR